MHLSTLNERFPKTLVAAAILLVVVGLVAIARSDELAGEHGRFSRQQLMWVVPAVVVALVAATPSYRQLCHWSYAIYGLAIVLLVAAFFFPAVHGTHRWIRIGGVGLQPSECAKLAFVVAMARWLMYRDDQRRALGLLVPLGMALVPAVLVLREPDLGTSLIFLPVLYAMLFVAGARVRDLMRYALVGLLVLPILWSQMSREQRSRVTALWEQTGPGERPSDDGFHLHQSKQSLALGGITGSWLRGNDDKLAAAYHLPEDHCDFIFIVLGERFGWFGTGGVLALYVLLVWQMTRVAIATSEPFGRLVAAGLASLIAVEVLINAAMTVGLLPVTGMSLPLVSYGGSGMITHGAAIGLVVNIACRPGYELAAEPFRFVAGAGRKLLRRAA